MNNFFDEVLKKNKSNMLEGYCFNVLMKMLILKTPKFLSNYQIR